MSQASEFRRLSTWASEVNWENDQRIQLRKKEL